MSAAASARPPLPQVLVGADVGRGGGGAHAEPLRIDRDVDQFRDALDVDEGRGSPDSGAALDQEVGAARQRELRAQLGDATVIGV